MIHRRHHDHRGRSLVLLAALGLIGSACAPAWLSASHGAPGSVPAQASQLVQPVQPVQPVPSVPSVPSLQSVPEGLSVFTTDNWGGETYAQNLGLAVSPDWYAWAGWDGVMVEPTDPLVDAQRRPYASFKSLVQGVLWAVPSNETSTVPVVAWSSSRDRFIAVLPSYPYKGTCASGHLNIAVSATADPRGAWIRSRIALPDARADTISLAVSDDKVVLVTSEMDLDAAKPDCHSTKWEGSRVRVVDWVDLADGGTLTVRDVSPTPRTGYRWLGVATVPTASSPSVGTTARLVAHRRLNGAWTSLEYATVTGSARAGTARLAGAVDLTATGVVGPLVGPPAEPVMAGTDGRPLSAAWNAGRLWVSAYDACTPDGDTVVRACARFIELDTTTPTPTRLEDAHVGTAATATILPLVGLSRDGTAYLTMRRSADLSSVPLALVTMYRHPGEAIAGGRPAVVVRQGNAPKVPRFDLGEYDTGSLAPDARDPGAMRLATWVTYLKDPGFSDETEDRAVIARLQGGLTGAPGGTVEARQWATAAQLTFAPSGTSPIVGVRLSFVADTEPTPGGPRLLVGRDVEFESVIVTAPDEADLGGTPGEGPRSVWVQWRTVDGTWSDPLERTFTVDTTAPSVTGPASRFELHRTVGTVVAIRTEWSGSDTASGVERFEVVRHQRVGPLTYRTAILLPTPLTTSIVPSLRVGRSYRYFLWCYDQAGNLDYVEGSWFAPRAYQGASAAIAYHTAWATAPGSHYLAGSTRYSGRRGARATFTFTGRAAAIVGTRGPARGAAQVWVDGVKVATIDTYASTVRYRQVVWQTSWATSGHHRIEVRVVGTFQRPRFDLDAFLKL